MAKKIANVILMKCDIANKIFGARVEKIQNDWLRTWAFPLDEDKAKREGFINNKVEGSLNSTKGYEGCPYCHSFGFVKCGICNRLTCYHGGDTNMCAWCNIELTNIETAETFNINAGGY